MATTKYPDPATKTKLLYHMNHDHTSDLRLYLRHLLPDIPKSELLRPELIDIDLSSLTIRTGKDTTRVLPINPPMESWADRRAVMVRMSKEAARVLGEPMGLVTTWRAPGPLDSVVMAALLFYYTSAVLILTGNCTPDSLLYRFADTVGTPVAAFMPWDGRAGDRFVWLTRKMVVPVLAIHFFEMWWFDRSRLSVKEKSDLKRGSAAWWLWLMGAFFEGMPSMWRFDRLLEEEKAKFAKRK